jgi:hypothetical protein
VVHALPRVYRQKITSYIFCNVNIQGGSNMTGTICV